LKLKPYSHKQVIKILNSVGFKLIRQRGSHIVLKGFFKEMNRTVIVPKHDEIAIGTLRGILFQAGLTVEEFVDLAEKSQTSISITMLVIGSPFNARSFSHSSAFSNHNSNAS
jgi:predicted RNA binding protein YcfA (HicA-like mRNA interferase family)